MLEYLIGVGILAVIWAILLVLFAQYRRPMIWSGGAYILTLSVLFVLLRLFSLGKSSEVLFIPGYWNPQTLFDLGQLTGGYSLEDAFFMFFVAGIVTCIHLYIFGSSKPVKGSNLGAIKAISVGIIGALLVTFFGRNLIYSLIAFGFVGAFYMWVRHPKAIKQSLITAVIFLFVYVLAFSLFNFFFPDFIVRNYGLDTISGLFFCNLPLEELLYAFSFALLWGPLYALTNQKIR